MEKIPKIPDLASLSPCQQVLRLHALRANAIASIRKNLMVPMPPHPNVVDFEWSLTNVFQMMLKTYSCVKSVKSLTLNLLKGTEVT